MCIRDSRNDLATDTSGDYAAHFELFFGHILPQSVSYTHLDVYKRQTLPFSKNEKVEVSGSSSHW